MEIEPDDDPRLENDQQGQQASAADDDDAAQSSDEADRLLDDSSNAGSDSVTDNGAEVTWSEPDNFLEDPFAVRLSDPTSEPSELNASQWPAQVDDTLEATTSSFSTELNAGNTSWDSPQIAPQSWIVDANQRLPEILPGVDISAINKAPPQSWPDRVPDEAASRFPIQRGPEYHGTPSRVVQLPYYPDRDVGRSSIQLLSDDPNATANETEPSSASSAEIEIPRADLAPNDSLQRQRVKDIESTESDTPNNGPAVELPVTLARFEEILSRELTASQRKQDLDTAERIRAALAAYQHEQEAQLRAL